jgi:hypothetical protein
MAEHIDRDAGGKIEIAIALSRDQPRALTPLESKVDTRIGRQQVRGHGTVRSSTFRSNWLQNK